MYFPALAPIGQVVQKEGGFTIHQVAHNLPVNPINPPLALSQQDVMRLPMEH
jgi:hypothetical protein